MSSDVMKYMFESHEVRVEMDAQGEPWFVAADVADALEYRDAHNLTRMLPDDEKGTHAVSTLGGSQMLVTISEPGLYRAVFLSKAQKAERFRRWVTHEVLPAIRKTGTYTAPVAAKPLEAPVMAPEERSVRFHMAMAQTLTALIPGLNVGIAGSLAIDSIHRETGRATEQYRALLPAATGPVASLNATAVGKALGVSARRANQLLAEKGFQRKRDKGGWEVTEEGARYGEMRPFTNNGHSDFQPLWREEVVQALR